MAAAVLVTAACASALWDTNVAATVEVIAMDIIVPIDQGPAVDILSTATAVALETLAVGTVDPLLASVVVLGMILKIEVAPRVLALVRVLLATLPKAIVGTGKFMVALGSPLMTVLIVSVKLGESPIGVLCATRWRGMLSMKTVLSIGEILHIPYRS